MPLTKIVGRDPEAGMRQSTGPAAVLVQFGRPMRPALSLIVLSMFLFSDTVTAQGQRGPVAPPSRTIPQAQAPAAAVRVFLRDGTALPSSAEFAIANDRIIFVLSVGDPRKTVESLLISLPVASVDLARTTRYLQGVRAREYAATRGLSAPALAPPASAYPPELPAPTLRESIDLALAAAAACDVPLTRDAILQSAFRAAATAPNAADLRADLGRRLGAGVVRGTVTDQTGAVMVGIDVRLASLSGEQSTTTDGTGAYRFPNVRPGRYMVRIAVRGFSPVGSRVDVTGSELAPVNIMLKAEITTHIDVTGGSLFATGNLSSVVLRGNDIAALPSDERLFWQRLADMAGAAGRPEALTVYVDGFRRNFRLPPKEVIESIRIDSNPFAAEFQEPGKGRVEITTKPGSQELAGQASFNFTDAALNARNALANDKPAEQYRRYSGWLTGPIIPGRWGFLAYAGRWEQNENAVLYATGIDPATGQTQLINSTVPTPGRTTSVSIRANTHVGARSTMSVLYERTNQSKHNLGVGGTNLLDTAVDQSKVEQIGEFSVVSTWPRLFNELQGEFVGNSDDAHALGVGPSIVVFDAFTAGANQFSYSNVTNQRRALVADALMIAAGKHTIKVGGRLEVIRVEETNRANFGGSFMFGTDFERNSDGLLVLDDKRQPTPISPLEAYRRTIAGAPGYYPLQFSINQGNPNLRLTDWQLSWFAQDDWQASNVLTVSYGVRRVVQSQLSAGVDLAPRAAVAWMPSTKRKGTIRAGFGVFHSLVDADPLLDAIRFDGLHAERIVVRAPTFFPNVPADLGVTAASSTTASYVRAPDLRAPSVAMAGVSYEFPLPRESLVSAGYTWQGGSRLLRSRNINPSGAPVLQLESTGRSSGHALTLQWRRNVGSVLSVQTAYTFGSKRNDTDGPRSVPADGNDLAAEFGPAADDLRHQINWTLSTQLPGRWLLSGRVNATSAPPLNITTGRDNNGDTEFTDRPAPAEANDPDAIATAFGLLTPNPAPGQPTISRNYGRQKGRTNVSLSLIKTLPHGATLSIDASNLFNQTQPTGYNGVLTSPTFGQPTRALPGRRIEIGFSVQF